MDDRCPEDTECDSCRMGYPLAYVHGTRQLTEAERRAVRRIDEQRERNLRGIREARQQVGIKL